MEPIDMYAPPAATSAPIADGPVVDAEDRLGWIILSVPVLGGIVGPLTTLFAPDLATLVGFPMIIATIILIAKDAPRWGLRPSKQVLGLIVLWLIYFPVYFHRRAKKGAPPRVGFAICSMLSYFGGFFLLGVVRGLSA